MKTQVDITNYDRISSIYTDHINDEGSWNNIYERPYMLSVFDDFTNKCVLDLGCGTGFYSFHALEQKAIVTSIDASQNMLDYINRLDSSGKIKLIKSDLTEGFPFLTNDSQDYIICSLVLHYLENWEFLIKELFRVLKKNGKVYISTHHPFSDFVLLKKESYFDKYIVEDTWGTKENPFQVHYFTRSLTDLLKPFLESEFKILKIEEPQPTNKCKELDIEAYRFLKSNPSFIFLILEK